MRVTFVLPYAGLAGGTKVVAIYAERLQRRGHQVQVVSAPLKRFPLRRRVKWFLAGKGWISYFWSAPSHFDGLEVPHHVIDRWRPVTDADVPDADVVVATWWETAVWVALLSPNKGTKVLLIQGYEVLPGQEKPALDATWRLPFHRIVISKWLVDLAATRFGDTDVSHVPNSVDMSQFNAPPRWHQAVPTVGLLYASERNPFKGVEVSSRAIELARRRIAHLRVVAFGAERPTRRLPLPANTEFHYRPIQNRIREIYEKCDVWLCGSRREGFHLPPLEAMACRCPVVSTRVGGPMDTIEEGVNGFLADIEDAEALADQLVRVLTMPEVQWRAMSDAAYATANRYTWDDATELFEAALRRAIERKHGGELARHGTGSGVAG